MARDHAPPDIDKMFSLRIGNISTMIKTEDLLEDFKKFGEVGDFFRPTNMKTLKPCFFAFIRYRKREDAENAMKTYHNTIYGDRRVVVYDANEQDSFFTQDTGFITNEKFDHPQIVASEFDSSLPTEHYKIKHERELERAEIVYPVRVDEIPLTVKKEEFLEICRQHGEVSSIYFPMNLKNMKSRGFAIVRYTDYVFATKAIEAFDGCYIAGADRTLRAKYNYTKEYLSQNENPKVVTGLAYNKYADLLPSFRE